jgi:TniQ
MQDNVPPERYSHLNQQEQHVQKYVHKALPLPRRVVPQPWEDLASVLSRTASKMGYEHPQWLLSQTNIQHKIKPGALSVLRKRSDYLFLGRQLLLEEEQLYALTIHRFASRLYKLRSSTSPFPIHHQDRNSIDRPLLWHEDQHRFFLSETYTRICPFCLEEDDTSRRHDRLFWRYRYILICPKHHVFLVSFRW